MLLTALLLRAPLAQPACDASKIDAYIQTVEASSDPDAYGCLAQLDEAGVALLGAVEAAEAPSPQLTRALTVHWMQRLDQPVPHEVARALPAPDRRILSDAVRARHGRASPAPEHARVFEQFDWYTPDERYTDQRLTEQDRTNLTNLAKPPAPPPPPEEPSAAEAIAEVSATPATERGCATGCAATSPASLAPTLFALSALIAARRRGSSRPERRA